MNDQPQAKCLNCGSSSDKAVLLSCVKDEEQNWVCVHCLPMLIHGEH